MDIIRSFSWSSSTLSLCERSSSVINATRREAGDNAQDKEEISFTTTKEKKIPNTFYPSKAPFPQKARVRKYGFMNKFSNYFRITSPVIQFNACVAQSPTTDPLQSLSYYSTCFPLGLNDVIHTSPTTNTFKQALIDKLHTINLKNTVEKYPYNRIISQFQCA